MLKVGADNLGWLARSKSCLVAIETLVNHQPSAQDLGAVENFYGALAEVKFEGAKCLAQLERLVSIAHVEYFSGLDDKDRVWQMCKASSTNLNRYGNVAAGEQATVMIELELQLKLIETIWIGYNSLLKALK